MQVAEKTSSSGLIRKTDPEDFDLVIVGGGTGSTVAACSVDSATQPWVGSPLGGATLT
jgi:hypothetical protein